MDVLIIEDEPLASKKLIKQLNEISESIEVLDVLDSVAASKTWLSQNPPPDLLMCDIHLSDGLCFEIFKAGQVKCPVIFTTAYDHYAIRAFEVNSISYLLKPVQTEQLRDGLNKYKRLKDDYKPYDPTQINRLVDIIRSGSSVYKSRFLVKVGTKIKSIPCNKIAYFLTQNKLNYLQTFSGEKFLIDHTLEEVDNSLDPRNFFRVNRKIITHIEAVREVHTHFKGRVRIELKPPVDEDIIVSADKTPVFKEWLDH